MSIETETVGGAVKYVPRRHEGDRLARLRGILDEIADIENAGEMREHAKDRECNRLIGEMQALGGEFQIGFEEDEGFIMVRDAEKPHGPRCSPPDACYCDVLHRAACSVGGWFAP